MLREIYPRTLINPWPKRMSCVLRAQPSDPSQAELVTGLLAAVQASPFAAECDAAVIEQDGGGIHAETNTAKLEPDMETAMTDAIRDIAARFPGFDFRLIQTNQDDPADSIYRSWSGGVLTVENSARVISAAQEYDDATLRKIANLLEYHGHCEAAAIVSARVGAPAGSDREDFR